MSAAPNEEMSPTPNEEISPTQQRSDTTTTNNMQNTAPSVMSPSVHSVPPLPSCELTDPHDDITLPRLIEALQNRQRIKQRIIDEYSRAADTMKSMLDQLDSDLLAKENVIHEQNSKLAENERVIQNNEADIKCLEKKVKMHENKIDNLQKEKKIYEDDKRSLQQELETREGRLQRELSEKRRMEQHMHTMVKDTQLKWEKECDKRVNAVHMEMQNKLLEKEEKLKQVKAIVMGSQNVGCPNFPPCHTQPQQSSREEDFHENRSASLFPCSVDSPQPGPHTLTRGEMVESRPRKGYPVPSTSSSCSELLESLDSSDAYHSRSTPMRTQHPASSGAKRARRRAGCWTPEQDEKGSPSRNLTLKQRSYETPVRPLHHRSPGREKWVDHKPSSCMDLGTVMQPVISNAIEVSSPNEKTLSKCDRYMLTHQEVVSDDEIQTHLIKGDVIKTRGGGQAVQFTEIETLRQEHIPTPRLRKL